MTEDRSRSLFQAASVRKWWAIQGLASASLTSSRALFKLNFKRRREFSRDCSAMHARGLRYRVDANLRRRSHRRLRRAESLKCATRVPQSRLFHLLGASKTQREDKPEQQQEPDDQWRDRGSKPAPPTQAVPTIPRSLPDPGPPVNYFRFLWRWLHRNPILIGFASIQLSPTPTSATSGTSSETAVSISCFKISRDLARLLFPALQPAARRAPASAYAPPDPPA